MNELSLQEGLEADAGLLGRVLQGGQQDGHDRLDLRVSAPHKRHTSRFLRVYLLNRNSTVHRTVPYHTVSNRNVQRWTS
jgi:hypothetical protein